MISFSTYIQESKQFQENLPLTSDKSCYGPVPFYEVEESFLNVKGQKDDENERELIDNILAYLRNCNEQYIEREQKLYGNDNPMPFYISYQTIIDSYNDTGVRLSISKVDSPSRIYVELMKTAGIIN